MPVTKYIYDGDAVLQETDGTGVTQVEYTRTGGGYGDLLSAYDGTSAKYYEPDALGSTDALADQTQAVTDRWQYKAFGTAVHVTGSDPTPFTWVGRQGYVNDPETGLYLLGAGIRSYDPAVTQFLSRDPIIRIGNGSPNPYEYAYNSPTMFIDLTGLSPIPSNRESLQKQIKHEEQMIKELEDELSRQEQRAKIKKAQIAMCERDIAAIKEAIERCKKGTSPFDKRLEAAYLDDLAREQRYCFGLKEELAGFEGTIERLKIAIKARQDYLKGLRKLLLTAN